MCLLSARSEAFWVLNFSTGQTLAPGQVAFIGGTGGQLTFIGEPSKVSFTPFLAHAGIRIGLFDRLDIGYRLVTVPLPYNSVGPTLGAASDLKFRFTPEGSSWHAALIAGGAFAYLHVADQDRTAWSPGADLILSHTLSNGWVPAVNARYVFTAIPSAPGGAQQNHVHAFGGSASLKIGLTRTVSVIPELGVFRFDGAIGGVPESGWGGQYGAVLSAAIQ